MRWTALIFALVFLFSCKKEVHEDLIIWGNTPPPYSGMSSAELQSLVNKIYIDLIGRGPTPQELTAFIDMWKTDGLTKPALESQVSAIQQTGPYFRNLDVLFWAKCLNATDSLTLESEIYLYNYLIDIALIVGDTALAYFYEPVRDDLLNLQAGASDWQNGEIGVDEYLARIIHNVIYDNVNMGSENYVLATFENLYFRKPTDYELIQGIYIVDGVSGFLFLQDGNSKRDFVYIATHSPPFSEGLVLEAYRHLLGRRPNSSEMIAGLEALGFPSDYPALQRAIITGSDYADL